MPIADVATYPTSAGARISATFDGVGELCDWSYHKLLVVHNSDGKLVADLAAVEFVDGMSYDLQHKRLYLAGD